MKSSLPEILKSVDLPIADPILDLIGIVMPLLLLTPNVMLLLLLLPPDAAI